MRLVPNCDPAKGLLRFDPELNDSSNCKKAVEMGKTMYKDETIRGRHKPANGIGLSLNLNKLFCSKARVLVSNHSHQGNLFNE